MRQNSNLKTYEWLVDFAENTETSTVHQKVWQELMNYIPEATWCHLNPELCSDRKSILFYLNREGYNMKHILDVVLYRKIFC